VLLLWQVLGEISKYNSVSVCVTVVVIQETGLEFRVIEILLNDPEEQFS